MLKSLVKWSFTSLNWYPLVSVGGRGGEVNVILYLPRPLVYGAVDFSSYLHSLAPPTKVITTTSSPRTSILNWSLCFAGLSSLYLPSKPPAWSVPRDLTTLHLERVLSWPSTLAGSPSQRKSSLAMGILINHTFWFLPRLAMLYKLALCPPTAYPLRTVP